MKKIAVLIFFLSSISSFAQNKLLDSLWKVYKKPAQQDTSRLKTLGVISQNYAFVNPDTGRIVSRYLITEARRLKISKAEAAGYNTLGVNFMYMDSNMKALASFDVSYAISEKLGDKSRMGASLMNKGLVYSNLADHRKALEFKLKSLKLRQ